MLKHPMDYPVKPDNDNQEGDGGVRKGGTGREMVIVYVSANLCLVHQKTACVGTKTLRGAACGTIFIPCMQSNRRTAR